MSTYLDDTSRFEFKRDESNGMMIGPDGCHYDTEAEAMYFGQTVGCGCGNPEEVHQFLINCSSAFDRDEKGWGYHSGIDEIKDVISSNLDICAEFIGHYLNDAHIAEHGGSVFGSWLTERGKQFVEIGPHKDDC